MRFRRLWRLRGLSEEGQNQRLRKWEAQGKARQMTEQLAPGASTSSAGIDSFYENTLHSFDSILAWIIACHRHIDSMPILVANNLDAKNRQCD